MKTIHFTVFTVSQCQRIEKFHRKSRTKAVKFPYKIFRFVLLYNQTSWFLLYKDFYSSSQGTDCTTSSTYFVGRIHQGCPCKMMKMDGSFETGQSVSPSKVFVTHTTMYAILPSTHPCKMQQCPATIQCVHLFIINLFPLR